MIIWACRRSLSRLVNKIEHSLGVRNVLIVLGWIAVLYFYHLWLLGAFKSPGSVNRKALLQGGRESHVVNTEDDDGELEESIGEADESGANEVRQFLAKRERAEARKKPAPTQPPLLVEVEEPPVEKLKVTYEEKQQLEEFERDWFNGTLRPRTLSHPIVPNIAHFIWFGCHQFEFHNLISLLSAYRLMQADRILFHTDCEPTGRWWMEAKLIPVLEIIRRTAPNQIYNQYLNPYWTTHPADIARLDVLEEYGGVYLDPDVFIVNSLEPLRHYEYVMGRARGGKLSNAVIISTIDSRFLRLYRESYQQYNSTCRACNSMTKPHEIAYMYKDLIHIEALTLDCAIKACWRTQMFGNFDWKHTRYALHFPDRSVTELLNPESIKKGTSTAAEVSRYAYYGRRDIVEEGANIPPWWRQSFDLSEDRDEIEERLRQAEQDEQGETLTNPAVTKTLPSGTLQPSRFSIIDDVAHTFWLYCRDFEFYHLLSLLSMYRYMQIHHIVFYTACTPSGEYWEQARKIPILRVSHSIAPTEINQHKLNPDWKVHINDLAKVMVLRAYGGIAVDLDVFVVNSFSPLRHFSYVMSLHRLGRLSNSVVLSKKESPFLRLYYENYKEYNKTCYYCNSVIYPTKLAKVHKELLHVVDFNEQEVHVDADGKLFYENVDWKTRRFAVQFPKKSMLEKLNPTLIRRLNSTLGEISRYIYYGSTTMIPQGFEPKPWSLAMPTRKPFPTHLPHPKPHLEDLFPVKPSVSDDENAMPANEDAMPANEEVIPANEEVIPANEDIVPVNEETISAKEEIVPDSEDIVPADESNAPAKEETMPSNEEVIPRGKKFRKNKQL